MTDSSHAHGSGDTKVQHPVQETLAHPMQTVTTAMEKVPGAERVKGFVDGVLDSVGIVSPHTRRLAAYTGAGLLGVAGVVEWPVVAAGAAVVWLTQPRPKDVAAAQTAGEARAEALQAKHAAGSAKASTATGKAKSRPGKATSGTAKARAPKSTSTSGTAKARSSKRAATNTSRTKAGGRKKP
ncbi:hypothetical protein [Streptomyces sp. NBC_01320]|uniref:hypothetical protein n=1 Tax=Streptomyces sp. NBC_01320 TaxID=2903824 RepID=UPI002E1082A4|nr:hypothetical protein OG395_28955 [Streptomyces sp. NBC_01320]